jgi:hypothetical protein
MAPEVRVGSGSDYGKRPFACAVLLAIPAIAVAGELGSDTLDAWNQYIAAVNLQMQARLDGQKPFLSVEEKPDLAARLRRNEIVVMPGDDHGRRRVASGLIHHWIATAFMPDATVSDVIRALREYDRYSEYYAPAVIESKSLAGRGDDDRFSLRVVNKAVLSKIALDADFESSYFLSGTRGYKTVRATRVQQIEDYGQNGQRTLPADQGSGLIWRLYSIARFEERDGGVYYEIEAMALSRDIPASIEWMMGPMIRRVAKGSLTGMLQKTREAVLDSVQMTHRDPVHASPVVDGGSKFIVFAK